MTTTGFGNALKMAVLLLASVPSFSQETLRIDGGSVSVSAPLMNAGMVYVDIENNSTASVRIKMRIQAYSTYGGSPIERDFTDVVGPRIRKRWFDEHNQFKSLSATKTAILEVENLETKETTRTEKYAKEWENKTRAEAEARERKAKADAEAAEERRKILEADPYAFHTVDLGNFGKSFPLQEFGLPGSLKISFFVKDFNYNLNIDYKQEGTEQKGRKLRIDWKLEGAIDDINGTRGTTTLSASDFSTKPKTNAEIVLRPKAELTESEKAEENRKMVVTGNNPRSAGRSTPSAIRLKITGIQVVDDGAADFGTKLHDYVAPAEKGKASKWLDRALKETGLK